VNELADIHHAQLHNYLKAIGYRLGLIANFGNDPNLEWQQGRAFKIINHESNESH
jgi:GxxExxY protein